MKSFITAAFARAFPVLALRYKAYTKLIRNTNSYLYASGWMQSLGAGKPIDRHGNPIPWMNLSVVAMLEERLTPDLKLFEFGSGYSTVFYAARVASVVSVEYDEVWYQAVSARMSHNTTIIFRKNDTDGKYCRVIVGMGEHYDVVIIDGRDRVNCLKQSVPVLSQRGVILLDDSQRERYREGIAFALERGFKALNLEGIKSAGTANDRATILYREGNCLGI